MNVQSITTPASPSLASPLFDASLDFVESLTTYFTASVAPILEAKTVTEVALGYHRLERAENFMDGIPFQMCCVPTARETDTFECKPDPENPNPNDDSRLVSCAR